MDWLQFRDPVSTWTHLIWMLLAIPATWVLWRDSHGDRPKQWSMLVFGLSLIYCFLGSTLYHAVQLSEPSREAFAAMDYIGIYFLIAGSGTPIVFTLLRGRLRKRILWSVWLLAAAGAILRLAPLRVPTWLSTSIYLGMGWGLGSCYPELARVQPGRALRWIPLGGLLYTLGAFIFLFNWPVIWPGVFGSHELFHIFVMAGSFAHFWFIWKHVVPFQRVNPEVVPENGPESGFRPVTGYAGP